MLRMDVQLIRNATLRIEFGGSRFLVDPMLDPAGARPSVERSPQPRRNPLVELPMPPEQVMDGIDAVLITHLHADHFDETGARLLGGGPPVYCQPGDVETLEGRGMTSAQPVDPAVQIGDITVQRTGGRHGVGEVAEALGPVSGFVLDDGTVSLYVAGDTIWCDEVAEAIERHRPDAVVVNAGGARFVDSERLIMDADDVMALCAAHPGLPVIAVHLEAIDHCLLGRDELRKATSRLRVSVPEDGETVTVDRAA